jgi:NAD-dependent dihydropyrimidine dehydrogenase PreA subunit
MIVNDQLCLHCGACVGSCPTNSIFLHETASVEFLSTCIECELCVIVCPVGSIGVISKSSSKAGYMLVQEAKA